MEIISNLGWSIKKIEKREKREKRGVLVKDIIIKV
jgi:hypothetical protein